MKQSAVLDTGNAPDSLPLLGIKVISPDDTYARSGLSFSPSIGLGDPSIFEFIERIPAALRNRYALVPIKGGLSVGDFGRKLESISSAQGWNFLSIQKNPFVQINYGRTREHDYWAIISKEAIEPKLKGNNANDPAIPSGFVQIDGPEVILAIDLVRFQTRDAETFYTDRWVGTSVDGISIPAVMGSTGHRSLEPAHQYPSIGIGIIKRFEASSK